MRWTYETSQIVAQKMVSNRQKQHSPIALPRLSAQIPNACLVQQIKDSLKLSSKSRWFRSLAFAGSHIAFHRQSNRRPDSSATKSYSKSMSESELTLDGRAGSRLPPMLTEKSSESVQISRTMTPIDNFATIPFVPTPPVFPWSRWCPNLQQSLEINIDPIYLFWRENCISDTINLPRKVKQKQHIWFIYLRIAFEIWKKAKSSPVISEFAITLCKTLSAGALPHWRDVDLTLIKKWFILAPSDQSP